MAMREIMIIMKIMIMRGNEDNYEDNTSMMVMMMIVSDGSDDDDDDMVEMCTCSIRSLL